MAEQIKGKEASGTSEKDENSGGSTSDDSTSSSSTQSSPSFVLPASLQWIPANWKWSNIKVVLRCAIAAWLAVVLFVIPRVELYMGQVRVCFHCR